MTYRPHIIAALLGSAGVHAALIPEHLDEAPVLGAGFILSVVVALGLAGALAGSPGRRTFAIAGGTLLAFAAAYLYTRVTSLEALGIPHEEPDLLGLGTVALELAGAAFALRVSASLRGRAVLRQAT
jgi:hypothetical protein